MLRITIILLLLISCLYLLKSLALPYYPDFSVHYFGPKAILEGKNPYVGGGGFFIPDVYPPFTQLFFAPLVFFPYSIAEKIWTIISIASYLISVYLLFRISKIKPGSNMTLFLITLVNFSFFPLKFTLGMGQINSFILLLFTLFIYFAEKNKQKYAAFFLSISLLLKFFPLLIFLYLVIKKQWKAIIYSMIFFIFLTFISFLIAGQSTSVYFVTKVFPGLIGGIKTDYYNQSLSGFISRLISDIEIRTTIIYGLSLIILFGSVYAWLKSKNRLLSISLVACTSLIINSFSWQHHFILLLVSYIFIFAEISGLKSNKNIFYVFLGISYFLTALNIRNPENFPVFFLSHVFYGALILFGLNIYLILKGEKSRG